MPFFVGAGVVLLLSMYINLFFLMLMPVVIFFMRQMARRDEMIFRLLGLHLRFRMRVANATKHDGMWVFSPNVRRRKPVKHR